MIRRAACALALVTLAACRKDGGGFAGSYRSTWGLLVAAQQEDSVRMSYPRGILACRATGERLACKWESGPASGRAAFVRSGDTLTGTFGFGESDTDGGPWVMVKER